MAKNTGEKHCLRDRDSYNRPFVDVSWAHNCTHGDSMELFETARGHCEIQNKRVEIQMMRMRQPRQKRAVLTPVRCDGSESCEKSVFCRLVNPLTTRLPVKMDAASDSEAS